MVASFFMCITSRLHISILGVFTPNPTTLKIIVYQYLLKVFGVKDLFLKRSLWGLRGQSPLKIDYLVITCAPRGRPFGVLRGSIAR
jgi:hypothetical protein